MNDTEVSQVPPRGGTMKFTYASGARPLPGYTIKRGVGRGGFGEVYYALSDGGKEVALKLIRRNLDVELRGVGHCLNMKHPNLLGLYDIRKDDNDDSWVVMEYVSGECLEQVIARHPDGMPVAEVLSWIHAIGAGVAYLHDKGVVHRDLKPGNIFSDESVVKVGDYGLSKFISASRRSGQTESVGTVHYMAPEVANGRYGKEIDIYALGIMLYEMLTGRVPFDGESVGEVLMKHLTAEPDVRLLSEPYRGVVARALAKDPETRFRSVAEFLAGLPKPLTNGAAGVQPLALGIPVQPVARRVEGTAEPLDRRGAEPRVQGAYAPGSPAAPETVLVEVVEEEPVWKAVREACRQMRDAWNRANFNTATKIVLLVAAICLAFQSGAVLAPTAVGALVLYGVYRLVRAVVMARAGTATKVLVAAAAAPAVAAAVQPPRGLGAGDPRSPPAGGTPFQAARAEPQPAIVPGSPFVQGKAERRQVKRCEQARFALPWKPARERFTDLLGSMLLAAGMCAAVCTTMWLFLQERAGPEQFAWLALVSTAATWAVLIPSKAWEGAEGEPMFRRCILLVAGLAVGAAAFAIDRGLMVNLPYLSGAHLEGYQTALFEVDGAPNLRGYLAYFGFLFPILRWWKQADPLRTSRLSLLSVAICVFWAWLLGSAWPFPQPWGAMVAAATSVSIQLSSPWIAPQRRALKQAA